MNGPDPESPIVHASIGTDQPDSACDICDWIMFDGESRVAWCAHPFNPRGRFAAFHPCLPLLEARARRVQRISEADF